MLHSIMADRKKMALVFALCMLLLFASLGSFDLGMQLGYTSGHNTAPPSKLVSTYTEIELAPNQTMVVITQPYTISIVNLSYSIAAVSPDAQKHLTVEMTVYAFGNQIYTTGYTDFTTGDLRLTNANRTVFSIEFRANPKNIQPVVLDFPSGLYISGNSLKISSQTLGPIQLGVINNGLEKDHWESQ